MENLTHLPKLPSIGSFRHMTPLARRELLQGLLFISPWILGFLGFTLIPMVATLVFTFTNIKITDGVLNKYTFVGLSNYITMFQDARIWNARPNSSPGALWITIRFGLIALPVGIFVPLFIALIMNNKNLKGQNFFRSMF